MTFLLPVTSNNLLKEDPVNRIQQLYYYIGCCKSPGLLQLALTISLALETYCLVSGGIPDIPTYSMKLCIVLFSVRLETLNNHLQSSLFTFQVAQPTFLPIAQQLLPKYMNLVQMCVILPTADDLLLSSSFPFFFERPHSILRK